MHACIYPVAVGKPLEASSPGQGMQFLPRAAAPEVHNRSACSQHCLHREAATVTISGFILMRRTHSTARYRYKHSPLPTHRLQRTEALQLKTQSRADTVLTLDHASRC